MSIYNGAIEMGNVLGDIEVLGGECWPSDIVPVNPSVGYPSILTTPVSLPSITTKCTGDIINIPLRNRLFVGNAPSYGSFTSGAIWGSDVILGGGRVITIADSNWLAYPYRNDITATSIVKNIARFLQPSNGPILLYSKTGDAPLNITSFMSFVPPILSSMGFTVTATVADTMPSLSSFGSVWFYSLYGILADDEQDRVISHVLSGKGYYHGTEFYCCPDNNAVFELIINQLIV